MRKRFAADALELAMTISQAKLHQDPFVPPRWLRNAHLQSVLPSLAWRRPFMARRTQAFLSNSREYILDCGDGVRLMGLHSAHLRAANEQSSPLVILFHGWEGSADSIYLMSLGSYLYERGYDVFRLNFRDHGPTHHLNRDLFHSCRIAEVVGAVQAIQTLFSPSSLSLVGFSLGGNFALRVAVRAKQALISLQHVIAVCPVLSPRRTLDALQAGWIGYEKYFVYKWKNSLRLKAGCFPHYDFRDIFRLNNLNAMTDLLVQRHSEYADLDCYLNGYAIVGDVLEDLQIDSHIVLAADDPIIPVQDAKLLASSPHLKITTVPRGGHCGFLDRIGAESWLDRTVGQILVQ